MWWNGPDAGDVSGASEATFKNDQSDGITRAEPTPPNFNPATVTTLNVNELTNEITQAAGSISAAPAAATIVITAHNRCPKRRKTDHPQRPLSDGTDGPA